MQALLCGRIGCTCCPASTTGCKQLPRGVLTTRTVGKSTTSRMNRCDECGPAVAAAYAASTQIAARFDLYPDRAARDTTAPAVA